MPKDRTATIVDALFKDFDDLMRLIDTLEQPSTRVWTDNQFRRTLVMAIGSYFEHEIVEIVGTFIARETRNSDWVVAFARAKGIARQYHTYFKWDERNANQFFGLFGSECKAKHSGDVRASDQLREQVLAFLELGSLRNTLAHENFAMFVVEKTAAEVYARFKTAVGFVNYAEDLFEKYERNGDDPGAPPDAPLADPEAAEAPPEVVPPASFRQHRRQAEPRE